MITLSPPACWTRVLSFFVTGTPVPKGSMSAFVRPGSRFASVTASNGKTLRPWAATIGAEARIFWTKEPTLLPLYVQLEFHFARPKSHYRTGKRSAELRENVSRFVSTKPDADKLTRAVWDAMTGIVYRDDAQIVQERSAKFYASPGTPTGVRINVLELAP